MLRWLMLALAVPLIFFHDIKEAWMLLFGPAESVAAQEEVRKPPAPYTPDPRKELPRRAMPIEPIENWFSSDDYPVSAARESIAGRVRVQFTIGVDGHVKQCTPVESSGSPLLDATACGILQQHGRFWPARDKNGVAYPTNWTRAVRWVLPPE